jgi:predicted HTH transcriptional regulator
MTTREFLNAVISANISDEMTEKAQSLIAQADARNAKRASQPSKTAIANEPIKANIIALFDENTHLTASEVGTRLELSVQKASTLLRQLVEGGVLTAEEVKVPKKGKCKSYSLVK